MARPPRAAKLFNKLSVRLAGRRFIPLWVVLHHRGRKSGKQYTVPLAVIPTDTTFVIALPWGRETDWVRNVRAAGRCTVRWKAVDYECSDPTFVDVDTALAAAHGLTRRVLARMDLPSGYLQLNRRTLD
jgi:deazaflavin-dependent oxidoreductase (nitroreductase family)